MKKVTNYLYEKTGMYIDWDQLNQLPEIDSFIDIGVGRNGTPNFKKISQFKTCSY